MKKIIVVLIALFWIAICDSIVFPMLISTNQLPLYLILVILVLIVGFNFFALLKVINFFKGE